MDRLKQISTIHNSPLFFFKKKQFLSNHLDLSIVIVVLSLFGLLVLTQQICYSATCQPISLDKPLNFHPLGTILNHSKRHNNTRIAIEGYYIEGFEEVILSEEIVVNHDGSFFAKGNKVWVSWICPRPAELLVKHLKTFSLRQGFPPMLYGKVRIIGTFKTGGGFGHLGEYPYVIWIQEVYLVTDDGWCKPSDR